MNELHINGVKYELRKLPTITEKIFMPDIEEPPMTLVQPTVEFTMKAEFDSSVLNDLIYGVDMSKAKDQTTYTVMYSHKIQARRHKKKRINKKWAKRYGYITKQIVLENARINVEDLKGE